MRIAGIVILYHPGDEVKMNIDSYLPQIEKLYVADNTEGEPGSIIAQLYKHNKIEIVRSGDNEGIAKRLNDVATLAINAGFDWLLTMDQDSNFEAENIRLYLQCVQSYKQKDNVAMFGVAYEHKQATATCTSKEVKQLITSGSIINLQLFAKIGGFDEALFIDEVDTDYCYNAITKGYKIVKLENIFLNHSLGKVSFHTSLKSFKTTSRTLHSPTRLYYMIRNYFYINKKYPEPIFSEEKRRKRTDLLHRIKNNLLYGEHRFVTLKYIIKGWLDYKTKMNRK